METFRTVDIQELRARVARAEYDVDTEAVAEAILRRTLWCHDRPHPGAIAPHPGAMLAVEGGAGTA
ncbi:MAG: flagellar biosynthesis anti-sigma factor FlgM [Solirubrobacteraceae bacterium]